MVEVNEKPILFSTPMVKAILDCRKTMTRRVIKNPEKYERIRECAYLCPYGEVGSHLWVRETFYCDDYRYPSDAPVDELRESLSYRADHDSNCDCFEGEKPTWRPSIFMPRWASRVTLEITDIKVERLQDISDEDILAEGITAGDGVWNGSLRAAWIDGWNRINGKRQGCSWSDNPFVFVIGFKRIL